MKNRRKSLQKLTDSDEPTRLAEVMQQLIERNPPLPEDATPSQKQERIDTIIEGCINNPLVTEEQKDDLRNQTWESNHDELTRVIGKLIRNNGRMPTVNQISNESGLSRQTIHKHLKEFSRSEHYRSQLNQFRILSDRVLANLYKLAIEGDVRASKVFLDAIGSSTISIINSQSESINYIQVNSNIKIDQVTFANLPESVQQQIAGLILQGLQLKTK